MTSAVALATWPRAFLRFGLAVMIISLASRAQAAEVLVVTSFPSSFYEPFRRAFEMREPEIRLRMLNRKSTAAIAMVEDGRLDAADVLWASAPDAFEVLAAKDKLAPLIRSMPLVRKDIGGFPIDDPHGRFHGFAVSGYGITWNSILLDRASLHPPSAIAELVDPRFRGLVAMSTPSRSGTTHLMVETVLQRHGWQGGWEIWLGIGGNLATVTARSFSVSSGVANGRFAIGLSIDFLVRGGDRSEGVGFAYPRENVFLPGSIAVLRGSRQPEAAKKFAAFVLSSKGQKLLSNARLGRHPVAVQGDVWPEPDLFALATESASGFRFDAQLSGRRYELVNLLFDELVTERLARLQRFWRRHAEIGVRLGQRSDLIADHLEAARLARTLPDELAEIGQNGDWPEFRRIARGAPAPASQAAFVERVRAAAETRLARAEQGLDRLVASLSDGEPLLRGAQP
jgi:phosphoglycerate transport regulatory protein PgtC